MLNSPCNKINAFVCRRMKKPNCLWYIAGFCLVGAVWFFVPKVFGDFQLIPDSNLWRAAQTGDAFGGVNALFSGLALFGVGIAVVLQYKQLVQAKADSRFTKKRLIEQSRYMRDAALISTLPGLMGASQGRLHELGITEDYHVEQLKGHFQILDRAIKQIEPEALAFLANLNTSGENDADAACIRRHQRRGHEIASEYTIKSAAKLEIQHLLELNEESMNAYLRLRFARGEANTTE